MLKVIQYAQGGKDKMKCDYCGNWFKGSVVYFAPFRRFGLHDLLDNPDPDPTLTLTPKKIVCPVCEKAIKQNMRHDEWDVEDEIAESELNKRP